MNGAHCQHCWRVVTHSTTVPTKRSQVFSTYQDKQSPVSIQVCLLQSVSDYTNASVCTLTGFCVVLHCVFVHSGCELVLVCLNTLLSCGQNNVVRQYKLEDIEMPSCTWIVAIVCRRTASTSRTPWKRSWGRRSVRMKRTRHAAPAYQQSTLPNKTTCLFHPRHMASCLLCCIVPCAASLYLPAWSKQLSQGGTTTFCISACVYGQTRCMRRHICLTCTCGNCCLTSFPVFLGRAASCLLAVHTVSWEKVTGLPLVHRTVRRTFVNWLQVTTAVEEALE